MAANTQVIRMLQKQRAKLESKIAHAEQSIQAWKGQMGSLDGAIAALGGKGNVGRLRGVKGRKRGTWKPGGRGRPPQWYLDQQKAKRGEATGRSAKGKRKRKASAKQLAGLAKAREVLAKKRAAQASVSR